MTYSKMIEHPEPYPESNQSFTQPKHFVFTDVSWWDLMPAYNCDELQGVGTIQGERDIKVELLAHIGDFEYDLLYSYNQEDLDFMLEELKITYEIIKEV